ncbi:WSC domain-containing protein 1-like [Lytechinus variegatus]|uniref:WSC domain-containing protein 1-like n=1 Tax=Lytechinus variegatus TaxID=7654 RepID=UPI001BB14FB8|nr:WSC domain-containing protein 1-like [Lytechinus variegatus]
MPNGTFPLTALASFPGSGNTWMRHLIETSTGYATGDMYLSYILVNAGTLHTRSFSTPYFLNFSVFSPMLFSTGFIGGKVPTFSGRTLTIKSHVFHPKMDSAILIVRNPYRAMVAEFNRQKSNKTGFAYDGEFKTEGKFIFNRLFNLGYLECGIGTLCSTCKNDSKTDICRREIAGEIGWSNFVKDEAPKWFNLYEKYISECNHLGHTCKSMLIVYYEQLQLHLKDELRRILNYLNVTIDEQRLACTVRNSEGQFHRPKLDKTLDPFSQVDRSPVEESLKKYLDLIDQEGLEKPPLELSSFPNDI